MAKQRTETKEAAVAKKKTAAKPTALENKLLERVKQLHEFTRHPTWVELVTWVASKEASAKEALVTCKKGEVDAYQQQIQAARSFRERVLAPAEEFKDIPLFQQGWSVKVDHAQLVVTLERTSD